LVTFKIKGFPVPVLEKTYFQFTLSLLSLIFVIIIAGLLLARWVYWGKMHGTYQLIWGLSFIAFSSVPAGLLLEALGFEFADLQNPLIFFIYRQGMIVWAMGMWYGLVEVVLVYHTHRKYFQFIPTIIIGIESELIFMFGLFIIQNIELTMYAFLFLIFIPVSFSISYLWFLYYKKNTLQGQNKNAVLLLWFGFFWMGICYAAWGPWHFSELRYIYFVWYGLFLLSLIAIFIGFLLLQYAQDYDNKTWRQYFLQAAHGEPIQQNMSEHTIKQTILRETHEFQAIFRHELQNSLINISGFLKLIKTRLQMGTEEQEENLMQYLPRIESNVQLAMQILEDFKSLERLETRTLLMKAEKFFIFEMLKELLDTSRTQIKNQKFIINIPERDIECYGDKLYIQLAIRNVLANAIKYIDPNLGIIWMTAEFNEKKGTVQILIEDNGPGIPEDLKNVLFKKFSAKNTKFATHGLGIGLFLAKSILKHHGGEINCLHSTEERTGARFEIFLPTKIKNNQHFQLLMLF
jgi:signal transduction histidine kinase